MRRLVIDDLRVLKPAGEEDFYARSPEYGLYLLLNHGPWDEVYLDHDMGVKDIKSVCYKLEELADAGEEPDLGQIFIITSNAYAAGWMMRALAAYGAERLPNLQCDWITITESIDAVHTELDLMELNDDGE